MPRKPLKRITAWSPSRYFVYVLCALQAKYKFIDRILEPEREPLRRGKKIHKEAEEFSLGRIKKLPKSLELLDVEFKDLRKRKRTLQVEKQLAVDKSWNPVNWFAKDAWLRGVLDCMYVDGDTLYIIDYKTGKIRLEQMQQLEIYAILGFIFGPAHITKVVCEFWYLDQGEVKEFEATRKEALKLRKKWVQRTKKMLADTTFKPTPNDKCGWCWYGQKKKAQGGPGLCKF